MLDLIVISLDKDKRLACALGSIVTIYAVAHLDSDSVKNSRIEHVIFGNNCIVSINELC
jgi:hypothetical protein